MFCQICGARIPNGRTACIQCGAPAGRVASYHASAPVAAPTRSVSVEVRSCPRCGYHGPSQSYFSSGMHLLALLGSAVIFLPAAFVYLALRYSHRMCPGCGLDWGKEAALALPGAGGERGLAEIPPEVASMSEGRAKRFFSWMLFVFAIPLLIGGLVGFEPAALMFAMFFSGGGYLLRKSSNEDRMRRREAMLQSLQRPVLQLAAQRGGTLTVTEVAAEYGWSIPRAEKVLQSLEDGYRVMGDVTEDGVIVYNFLELTAAPAALPMGQEPSLPAPRPRPEAPLPLDRPTEPGSPLGMDRTG